MFRNLSRFGKLTCGIKFASKEERKTKMEAEKRKKEDEKRKRQQILSQRFSNTAPGQMGRNFIIPQKSDKADKFSNIVQVRLIRLTYKI